MGMVSFNQTCPHCLKDNAVLVGVHEIYRGENDVYDVTFFCRSCNKSGIAVVQASNVGGPLQVAQSAGRDIQIPSNNYWFELIDIYPKITINNAPENTPERAAKFFIESKDDFQRGRYETCVMNCRKVMDIATKVLMGDEAKDEKLSKRITMLFSQGKITEQMKDWAHIVRIDSNGAIHSDEEFTKEETKQILGFTEVFLMYSFTLPEMIKKRQEEKDSN
ncbi:DUF4145 domain-containing protein [Proteus mirabilis]|uniref:DUF4145 domain-containing protein n=1 Tax=Proteus mirabilis TaxID=584 RepID=UPI001FAC7B8B|nr:DUF4145 domain-containing protein [Proteus mirabilis]MCI9744035.1 DUF4145 domain-containing protein [Proteus mirabilis]MCI9801798.1 DUF4145 domain-containing protein [Proteus mirabilis]MCI9813354.1 DUF4145 domain-containing protein [Proteus mirabilis]